MLRESSIPLSAPHSHQSDAPDSEDLSAVPTEGPGCCCLVGAKCVNGVVGVVRGVYRVGLESYHMLVSPIQLLCDTINHGTFASERNQPRPYLARGVAGILVGGGSTFLFLAATHLIPVTVPVILTAIWCKVLLGFFGGEYLLLAIFSLIGKIRQYRAGGEMDGKSDAFLDPAAPREKRFQLDCNFYETSDSVLSCMYDECFANCLLTSRFGGEK